MVECAQHPDADKLCVTKVNVGGDRLLISCVVHLRESSRLKVACATALAVKDIINQQNEITRSTIRRECACSFSELGIDVEADGIIELPVDAN